MDTTFKEMLTHFDAYTRTKDGNVIINLGSNCNFLVLTEEFVQSLRADIKKKTQMCAAGVDELDPATKFAIMMLIDSY